jgi:hypothetical protein
MLTTWQIRKSMLSSTYIRISLDNNMTDQKSLSSNNGQEHLIITTRQIKKIYVFIHIRKEQNVS